MLNVTSKSENEKFLKVHEFVNLPKLESSRNVTSKVIARKSKSTEQFSVFTSHVIKTKIVTIQ